MESYFSEIETVERTPQRVACYAVVSPSPEEDSSIHLANWAKRNGLGEPDGSGLKMAGWNLASVPEDFVQRFGMYGYVSALALPQEFPSERVCGVQVAEIPGGNYLRISITEPFEGGGIRIRGAYDALIAEVKSGRHGILKTEGRNIFEFEEVFEQDGKPVMRIFFPVEK